MALHEVQLKGYSVRPVNLSLGTFDSYGIEQLHVTLDDTWSGLAVTATFNPPKGEPVEIRVPENGLIDVPAEATANEGTGAIVYCGVANGVQLITKTQGYNVITHGNVGRTAPFNPSESLATQVLQAALNAEKNSAEAKSVAEGLRNDAANGKFDGKDGAKGDKGETGTTPQLKIGEDNLWQVSYDNGATWVSLGVKATGEAGKDGEDGLTPHIGENGNWWVGDTDTGVSAKGDRGDTGAKGADGVSPTATVTQTDDGAEVTVTDASGTTTATIRNGTNGKDGAPGKDAVVDATLTQDGQAADAKVTGEKIGQLKEDVTKLKEDTAALKKRQNVLVGSETGNPASCNDAFAAPLCGLTVYGKSTQDGTPSPDTPVPIVSAGDSGSVAVKVTGANILYLPDIEENTVYGVTYSVKNGVIKIKGTSTGKSVRLLRNIKLFVGTGFFNPNPVKGTESSNCYLDLTNTINLGFSIRSNNINEPVKITELNVKYPFYLNIESTAGSVIDMEWKPQMLLSDKLLPYSPYREQLLTLLTPNGLPGIPVTSGGNYTDKNGQQWICDEVDLERGVKVQRVNAVDLSTCVITGTTNLVATKRLAIRLPLKGKDYTAKALCNRLPYLVSFTSDTIHFYVDTNNAQVFIPIGAKNPEEGEYILFYVLDAPIETPLTPAEIAAYKAITAYAPDTVVQASDDAGVKLEYQRDVNLVVKNLEDAIASMTTT